MAGKASKENGKLGGRPNGRKNDITLEKEAQLEYFRQRVFAAREPLINAQLSLAQGLSFLYKIKKDTGKGKEQKRRAELVTSQYAIEAYLSGEYDDNKDDYYYITTERPDNGALQGVFDRALGKAPQSLALPGEGEGEITIKWGSKPL